MQTGSAILDEIAAVTGVEAAFRLSARYRGVSIYVLKHYPDSHDVVAAIGREAADRLSEYFWTRTINIPARPGLRWAVCRLADKGELTRFEIADTLKINERQVYRILAEREKRRQPDLFDAA